MSTLDDIHTEIGNCSLCQEFKPLIKNQDLKRGAKSKIMVIGLSPGKTETEQGLAFSGQAGKKLFEWLAKANIGDNDLNIRNNVYFTSLIKCQKQDIAEITSMFKYCRQYLKKQINIVSPKIIIPLGPSVYNLLFNTKLKTENIVGKSNTFDQLNDSPLFPEMSFIYGVKYIVPFPHPSGLNRWLNSPENTILLNTSIEILNKLYDEK